MNANSMMATLSENSRRYEGELRQLQQALSSAHDQELRLQHSVGIAFQQIAGVQLAGGAQLSAEVQGLLDQRRQDEAELRERLAVAEARIAQQLQRVQTLGEQVERQLADVSVQLEQTSGYQQQVAALSEVEASGSAAAETYEELREECRTKLQAFKTDPLYLYLKRRQFATEHYARWTLWREPDKWIARLCNFPKNRESEQALLAIQQANESARSQFETERSALQNTLTQLFEQALAASEVPALREQLEATHQAVAADKAQANTLHERLSNFATQADEHFATVHGLLAGQLAQASSQELERLAASTTSVEDDELVRKVRDLRAELDELKAQVPFLQAQHQQAERDYARAKQVERDLLSGGRLSKGYTYRNGLDLESLLLGFMGGALSLSQVAREVDNHRVAATVASSSWIPSVTTHTGNSGSRIFSSSVTPTSTAPRTSAGFSTSDSL